jgi:hypothetical protein
MRTRAFYVRYKGPAFQSHLWTGVTSIGPSSHWSAVKCAPLNIACGLRDSKIWQYYSYTGFVILYRFPNEELSSFEVWLRGFYLVTSTLIIISISTLS